MVLPEAAYAWLSCAKKATFLLCIWLVSTSLLVHQLLYAYAEV